MFQGIARTVYTRAFAIPEAKNAIDFFGV